MAVRFGNVLGCSGSVVPDLPAADRRGGPVTVTHPEMTRYFMTIPEAAQLVVAGRRHRAAAARSSCSTWASRCGSSTWRGDMIRLSGREPGRDIADRDRRASGPGEKLHEELFEPWEHVEVTHHEKILRATRPPIDAEWLDAELAALADLVADGDGAAVEVALRRVIAARAPRGRRDRHLTMDTRQLAAFVAVVEKGSFSQAAESLGVTPARGVAGGARAGAAAR